MLDELERLRLDAKRLKEELSDARKQSGALKLGGIQPPPFPSKQALSDADPSNVGRAR